MNSGRFVDVTYCDDIRQELGNKMTLIGCYGPDLHVEKMPVALAKLCIFARAFAPVDRPFERLVFRVCLGQTTMAELPVDIPLDQRFPTRDGARWMTVNAAMTLSPFFIEAPGTLRVEIDTEDGVVIGPQLTLNVRSPPAQAPSKPNARKRARVARRPKA